MKTKLLFFLFSSLYFNAISQILFENHPIIDANYSISQPTEVIAADIDGDMDSDLIFGTLSNGRLYLLKNLDGNGNFGSPQSINMFVDGLRSIVVEDLDGDGDLDIVTASYNNSDDRVAWYENLDGQGNFGSQQIIEEEVASTPNKVEVVDLDGDGDMDILASFSGADKLVWYENLDGSGNFSNSILIASLENASQVIGADMDGDEDQDVIVSYYSNILFGDIIVWFENIDGQGNFGNEKEIVPFFSQNLIEGDVDNDGDIDLIASSYLEGKVIWLENENGVGDFGTQKIVTNQAWGVRSLHLADMDGDDVIDIVAGQYDSDKVIWYKNLDSQGNFGSEELVTNQTDQVYSVCSSDLDNDGNLDIISASQGDEKIAWYKNMDGLGNFGEQEVLTPKVWGSQRGASLIDFDEDGDLDLLIPSGQGRRLAWFENLDGFGAFGMQQILTESQDKAYSIHLDDIDNDGDQDVISLSLSNEQIVWYEKINGQEELGNPEVIADEIEQLTAVASFDVDNDGDQDVLSATFGDQEIAWYENLDGLGDFGEQQVISSDAGYLLFISDLNGDGFLDIVSATQNDSLLWFENTGMSDFNESVLISENTNGLLQVSGDDIDNDGDIDIITSSLFDGKLVWYENLDGVGSFSDQKVIVENVVNGSTFGIGDLDDDGDLDIYSATTGQIGYHENIDGQGSFSNQFTVNSDWSGDFITGADIDGDSDLDILSSSSGILNWYENLNFTSIDETHEIVFSIFPIPTSSELNIQSTASITQVEIYDNLGKLVLSSLNKLSLNLSSLPKGFYYCKIITEKGNWSVKKIIKN